MVWGVNQYCCILDTVTLRCPHLIGLKAHVNLHNSDNVCMRPLIVFVPFWTYQGRVAFQRRRVSNIIYWSPSHSTRSSDCSRHTSCIHILCTKVPRSVISAFTLTERSNLGFAETRNSFSDFLFRCSYIALILIGEMNHLSYWVILRFPILSKDP